MKLRILDSNTDDLAEKAAQLLKLLSVGHEEPLTIGTVVSHIGWQSPAPFFSTLNALERNGKIRLIV